MPEYCPLTTQTYKMRLCNNYCNNSVSIKMQVPQVTSYFPSLISRQNFFDPATLQRSPMLINRDPSFDFIGSRPTDTPSRCRQLKTQGYPHFQTIYIYIFQGTPSNVNYLVAIERHFTQEFITSLLTVAGLLYMQLCEIPIWFICWWNKITHTYLIN